ncbi:hypothetical protein LCGC14_2143440, partial [marine sediment metagenome]
TVGSGGPSALGRTKTLRGAPKDVETP